MPAHLDISQMSKDEIDLAFEASFKDFEEGCFCSSEEAFSRIKRRAAKWIFRLSDKAIEELRKIADSRSSQPAENVLVEL